MALASAKSQREGFLRRLEEQAQQQQPEAAPGDEVKDENEKESPDADGAENNAGEPQIKSPPEETGEKEVVASDGGADAKTAAQDNVGKLKSPPEELVGEEAKKPTPTPTGDQLLIDYLSKYCNPGAGGTAASPESWIQDVDASSLAFLKGLAGIQEEKSDGLAPTDAAAASALGNAQYGPYPPNFNNASAAAASIGDSSFTVNATLYQEEPTKQWEATVPPGAVPGEPFHISAAGVKVRVLCPKNTRAGQRIRFNLPIKLFEKPPEVQPMYTGGEYPPGRFDYGRQVTLDATSASWNYPSAAPPMAPADGGARQDASLPKSDDPPPKDSGKPKAAKSDKPAEGDENQSIQSQMLTMIERQQRQMQEMQARLDALGGMMASMDQNVRYLRDRQQSGGQIQEWRMRQYSPRGPPTSNGGAELGGYRIMGGLFSGSSRQPGQQQQPWPAGQRQWERQNFPEAVPYQHAGAQAEAPATQPAPPGAYPPAQPPQPPVPDQGQGGPGAPLPPQPQHPPPMPQAPQAPGAREQPRAMARPVANNEMPLNQGIFFPLFVMLFRFLFSLPGRLRGLLLSSGPGRVYAHLRERAIERRAFANVDLGSIMKLLVMLLIFAGRAGGRDGGGGRNNRRNQEVRAEAEDGMVAYAYSILRSMIDYWKGHRVHTLVLASFIAFLIQVGLMSFFYQVLWVERADLARAWLGQDNHEDDEAPEADGAAAAGGQANANGGPNPEAARQNNAAAPARPGGAAAVAAPQGGGLIRRGPNNGGILHDIQCLILSFLLSLIPAWRPEEAAREPEVQPEAEAAPEQVGEDQARQLAQETDADETADRDGAEGTGDTNAED